MRTNHLDSSVLSLCSQLSMRPTFASMVGLGMLGLISSIFSSPCHADEGAERLFTLKVLPLLKDKCLGCHGGDVNDIKGEFSVLDRESLLHGGESEEPAIIPGKPDEGTLMNAIAWEGYEMPPKENDRLNAQQIKFFSEWIEQGAPWPNEKEQERYRQEEMEQAVTDEGVLVPTSGGTSKEWTTRRYREEDVWAFQPLKSLSDAELDSLIGKEGSAGTGATQTRVIDALINSKLASESLEPAGEASPRDLIRRATYDLTGLPPTKADIESFEEAYQASPDKAWGQLIDRLLESQAYGEHWGRHWLDVTRYADTGGMSNDYERSNMWRYRDYVIRAFNDDKPYNDFVVEQLAGDELADASVRKRKSGDVEAVHQTQLNGDYTQEEAEWIVATGFLRLGPWDNAMVDEAEARQLYLDDLVNITGQTFLSQTLRCCKCHDHKFDPIPTRDYYSVYAAFATTHMAERKVPLLENENKEGFSEGEAHVRQMLEFAVKEKNKLVNKRETAARKWFEERGLPYKDDKARKNLPDEEKPPRHVGLDYVDEGQLKVREQDEWIWNRRLERYKPMAQSVYNTEAAKLAWNGARKLRIDRKTKAKEPLQSHIFLGGALTALGDQVAPGVLSALALSATGASAEAPFSLGNNVDGRRLGLARWIVNPSNALTSRSIVNRIWQFHFGKGIAANSNNFGGKGAKPTHPQLLDYLAADFVANGWTIKRMHRNIMMSSAYRRATLKATDESTSDTVKAMAETVALKDPNNELLSYFPRRRLTAEEIRDSILAITGELVESSGGLPISPEINMEVALQPRMIQFSLAPAYQPSPQPALRNRRTVYAYQVRGQADPFNELFNLPNPNESCELREAAAVTPQVFSLLNSDMMTDRAIALAKRIESEQQTAERTNEQKIGRAFQLIFGRDASQQEVDRLAKYIADMEEYHAEKTPEATSYPAKITRSLVEEFSGKKFEYTEILPIFEEYQPDSKPSDVSAGTRALADLCLLLMNSNEFMYVD